MTPDALCERLLQFSVRIGRLVDRIPDSRLGRHVAGQLVRCGTSPLPNYEEACAAESRADFIHKVSICLKELRESRSWLRLIICAKLVPESETAGLLQESTELCNILAQSVVTAKANTSRHR